MLAFRRISAPWIALCRLRVRSTSFYVNSVRRLCTEVTHESTRRDFFPDAAGDQVRPRNQFEKFRIGSVGNSRQLVQLVDRLKDRGELEGMSARQALQNCGRALSDMKPEKRVELAESFWKSFQEIGVALDVTHFNALLTAYVENDHKFAPLELVEEMRQKEISPNVATFQLLLKSYCQQGDLNGAYLVLNHMKSEGMPISEPMLAPLITGQARAWGLDEASEVFEKIRSEGVDEASEVFEKIRSEGVHPGLDSYQALLCSMAEKGNLDGMDKVFAEMNASRLFPPIVLYTELIETLSARGHTGLIDTFLDSIKNIGRMRSDLESLMHTLLVRGDTDAAMVVLLRIFRVTISSQSDTLRPGSEFLSHLLRNDPPFPVDFLLKTAFDMRSRDLHRSPYEELLLSLFNREDTESAVTVLKEMMSSSVPVKPHYFYPLLAQHKANNDLEGMCDVLKLMKDNDFVLGKPHLDYFVHTALKDRGVDGIMQTLAGKGVVLSPQEKGILMQSLVSANCIEAAAQVLTSDVISFEPRGVMGMFNLVTIPKFEEGVDSSELPVFKLFQALKDHPDIPTESLSIFGKELVTSVIRRSDPKTAIQTVETLLHMGVMVTHYLPYTEIMTALSRLGDVEKMQNLLQLMKEYGIFLDPIQRRIALRFAARTGKGDMAIETFIGGQPAEFEEPSQPQSELIVAYGRDQKRSVQSMMKIYEELVSKGMRPTASAYGYLVGRNLRVGNVSTAERLKEEMQEDYALSDSLYRMFMATYAKRGDVEALRRTISEADKAGHELNPYKWFLLIEAHAVHGDTETAEQFFDEMKRESHLENLRARPAWTQLAIAYANKGDVDGAVDVISRAKMEGMQPTLRTYFLIVNRAAVLKRNDIMKKMNELILEDFEVMKQEYVDGLLFYAHVKAGNLENAEELMPKVSYSKYESHFGMYVNKSAMEGDVERIQRVLTHLRDLPMREQYNLCGMPLLRAYESRQDPDGCLSVYEHFVSRKATVSPRFKVLLATILKEHNRAVPQQILRLDHPMRRRRLTHGQSSVSSERPSSADSGSDSDSHSSSSSDEEIDEAKVEQSVEKEANLLQSKLEQFDDGRPPQ